MVRRKKSYIQRNHYFTISGYITEKQQPYNLFLPHFCTTAVSVMTTTVCGHYLFSLWHSILTALFYLLHNSRHSFRFSLEVIRVVLITFASKRHFNTLLFVTAIICSLDLDCYFFTCFIILQTFFQIFHGSDLMSVKLCDDIAFLQSG